MLNLNRFSKNNLYFKEILILLDSNYSDLKNHSNGFIRRMLIEKYKLNDTNHLLTLNKLIEKNNLHIKAKLIKLLND